MSDTAATPTDPLADRLARCYTGVVFDTMRARGLVDCILPPRIVALDRGMVAAGRSLPLPAGPIRPYPRTRACCAD